jgi:hypothetical protein
MSPKLKELLFLIRQHEAFQELLNVVESPEPKPYSPSKGARGGGYQRHAHRAAAVAGADRGGDRRQHG